jgi:hypothetical protein
MSLIALVLIACVGAFAMGGLALMAHASLPEKFWNHADLGRYAGLAASDAPKHASMTQGSSVPMMGSLQDQSA